MQYRTPKKTTCQSSRHNVGELLNMFIMSPEEKKSYVVTCWCDLVTEHWLSAQIFYSEEHCVNFMVLLVLLSVR